MFLKKIKLTGFRNYLHLNVDFNSPITVLLGNNAQGKSNFLESIYFLATTKSPKADKDEELIYQGEEVLRVEGELEDQTQLEITLAMMEGSLRKRVKVNGIPRRTMDYSVNLAVVLFAPEDVNLVTGSPSLRRGQIDQTLSQIDRDYKKTLSNYENIVTRKNKVLKAINEKQATTAELTYWTDQQFELGFVLQNKRKQFFQFINAVEKKFGQTVFSYQPNLISKERLQEYQGREIAACNSLIGPHRDDFLFLMGDKDLSKYGSRGEQRTAVLDLKSSMVYYIEKVLGSRPILLLDDIFSELDTEHRDHVVEISKLQQTVIATVEWDKDLEKSFKEATLIRVEKGKVVE